jgi:LmbE family N-acetylglucosaminyl deacetylase
MISRPDACIVLLPHADDEAFVLPEIAVLYADVRVDFILLTKHCNHPIRLEESRNALRRMGYGDRQLYDFQTADDGRLLYALAATESKLRVWIEAQKCHTFHVISPAWEGGHQDHDACFLIAQQLQRIYGDRCKLRNFWLYNGLGTSGKFFRVARPCGNAAIPGNITWKMAVRSLGLVWAYPSQIKAWVALGAGFIWLRLWRRTLNISAPFEWGPLKAPHAGTLLYERYNRERWSRFHATVQRVWPEFLTQ